MIKARITTTGLALLKTMNREVEQFHRGLLGRLGDQRLQALIKLLEEARET